MKKNILENKSKTRILFIIPSMHFGGVEAQLLYLLSGLDPKLFDLRLALCQGGGDFLTRVPEYVKTHNLNHKIHRGINVLLVPKLARLINLVTPEIIISFHPSCNLEAYLAMKTSAVSCKVIGSLPGKVGQGRLDFIRIPILKKFDRLISVSQGVEISLFESYGILYNSVVIPNCVDISEIQKKGAEVVDDPWLNADIPVGITVGRLVKSKGIDVAIHSVIAVNKKLPFRLLIVGEGSEAEYLKSIVSQTNSQSFIKFLGYQDNPGKYVSKADLFIFTSLAYGEGLPTVLIEAMVNKTPIISTSYLNGKGEIIAHQQNGILISCWDPELIADGIIQLLKDEKLKDKIINNAYLLSSKEFNKETYIKRYIELFNSISA